MKKYIELEKLAFDEDINKAFWGSIELALELGVEENKILKSRKEIDDYFLI